jgi:HEAT repeat protein
VKKRRAIILVLLGVFVASLTYYFWRPSEPAYEGKRLSAWMDDLSGSEEAHNKAAEAIRHIGTNALPTLLGMLSAKDSRFKKTVDELNDWQSILFLNVPGLKGNRFQAVLALRELGPAAKPAIPQLKQLLDDYYTAPAATQALGMLGPEGYPPLIQAITNKDAKMRALVASSIGSIKSLRSEESDMEPVVVALIARLNDQHHAVRTLAAQSLGQLGQHSSQAVPALIVTLKDSHLFVRLFAIGALGEFGTQAQVEHTGCGSRHGRMGCFSIRAAADEDMYLAWVVRATRPIRLATSRRSADF